MSHPSFAAHTAHDIQNSCTTPIWLVPLSMATVVVGLKMSFEILQHISCHDSLKQFVGLTSLVIFY